VFTSRWRGKMALIVELRSWWLRSIGGKPNHFCQRLTVAWMRTASVQIGNQCAPDCRGC